MTQMPVWSLVFGSQGHRPGVRSTARVEIEAVLNLAIILGQHVRPRAFVLQSRAYWSGPDAPEGCRAQEHQVDLW